MVSKFQGFFVSKFQSFFVLKFLGFKVLKFLGFEVFLVSKFQSFLAPKFAGFLVLSFLVSNLDIQDFKNLLDASSGFSVPAFSDTFKILDFRSSDIQEIDTF